MSISRRQQPESTYQLSFSMRPRKTTRWTMDLSRRATLTSCPMSFDSFVIRWSFCSAHERQWVSSENPKPNQLSKYTHTHTNKQTHPTKDRRIEVILIMFVKWHIKFEYASECSVARDSTQRGMHITITNIQQHLCFGKLNPKLSYGTGRQGYIFDWSVCVWCVSVCVWRWWRCADARCV